MKLALLGAALVVPALLAGQAAPPPTLQVTPVHYELAVSFDFTEDTLHGTARITVRNTSAQPATEVPLVLYRLMEVEAALSENGDSLTFTQQVVRDPDFPVLQENAIRVRLPQPLPPGGETTIAVTYAGYLLGYSETGMLYIKDRIDPAFTILRNDALAFPLVELPSIAAQRAAPLPSFDYLARITVPDSLVVANGGRLVERTVANSQAAYVYHSIKPSWRMDFAIGDYAARQEGPVRIFYLQRDSAGAARVARAVKGSLDLFRSWFGPLPGSPQLTILELEDGFGSQTDVTTIVQAAAAFRDSTRNYEVYHEISHLWNPPETGGPASRWNEGLAMFLQSLATERLEGRQVLAEDANRMLQRLQAGAKSNPRWNEVPWVDYGREQMTDLSYRMGAVFFYLLYRRVGQDEFTRIIGGFSQQYAASGASARDFIRYAEQPSKADLRPLFQTWWLTTGWVGQVEQAATIGDLERR